MNVTPSADVKAVTSGCCGGDAASSEVARERYGCCGGSSAERLDPANSAEVRTAVREKYGAIAEGKIAGCGCGAGPVERESVLEAIGYTGDQIAFVPEDSNLGLGCGNPIAHAALKSGEVVLDLGSGAGIDCFLAARAVGPTGRAIGVDMTPAMVEKARANTAKHGVANVEFRLGEIEHLPVADSSVDVVISNCVINLSTDKPRVFREAHRALKPGGRLLVSDLVLIRPLPPEMQRSVDLYVGCVAGASLKEDYLALARDAGFDPVEIVEERGYEVGTSSLPADSPERAAFDVVRSVKVRAIRR
jgi:arsenite methyltransferase